MGCIGHILTGLVFVCGCHLLRQADRFRSRLHSLAVCTSVCQLLYDSLIQKVIYLFLETTLFFIHVTGTLMGHQQNRISENVWLVCSLFYGPDIACLSIYKDWIEK